MAYRRRPSRASFSALASGVSALAQHWASSRVGTTITAQGWPGGSMLAGEAGQHRDAEGQGLAGAGLGAAQTSARESVGDDGVLDRRRGDDPWAASAAMSSAGRPVKTDSGVVGRSRAGADMREYFRSEGASGAEPRMRIGEALRDAVSSPDHWSRRGTPRTTGLQRRAALPTNGWPLAVLESRGAGASGSHWRRGDVGHGRSDPLATLRYPLWCASVRVGQCR